jgi:hypothetical protein
MYIQFTLFNNAEKLPYYLRNKDDNMTVNNQLNNMQKKMLAKNEFFHD